MKKEEKGIHAKIRAITKKEIKEKIQKGITDILDNGIGLDSKLYNPPECQRQKHRRYNRMSISIEEAKVLKEQTENKIPERLLEFADSTGLEVRDVRLESKRQDTITGVKLKCVLR